MASLFANFLFGIRKLIFSSIIVAAVFGMLAPLISVQAAPSCPLSSQSGRTIITFGGATLNPNVKLSPVPVTIPAGTYNITLVSYDNHVSETDTQPNEQWYIIAKNSQGSPVVVSDSIADLANGQDTLTHVVNTDFRVLSAIASVSAYHTIQNGSTDPNSVIPLCVAFDSQNKFPIVSTNEASAIAYNEATLNGRVDPVGALDTVKWFEWGTSVSLGLKTEATAQGTPPSSFSFRLTSLLPNTTYYFRAFAKNAQGTASDITLSFHTKGAAEYTPFVSTDAASGISESQATLNGYLNPNGSSDTVRWFEWGITPMLGSKTQEIAAGSAVTTISHVVSGLSRSTTYYVKAFARNGKGTSEGGLITFQTTSGSGSPSTSSTVTTGSSSPPPPSPSTTAPFVPIPITPTAITKTPTFVAQNTVVLNGLALADTGVSTHAWFEWGTSQSLGLQTTHRALGSITSADFADSLVGLAPNTIYYFRAVVENARGKSFGVTFLFRTLAVGTGGSPSSSPLPSSPSSSSSSSLSPSSPSSATSSPKIYSYVPRLGNIALSITPSQDIVRTGEKVKFTVVFENKVKDFLSDVLLTVTLSPELTYNQLSGSPEGIHALTTVEGQIITLSVGDMTAGDKGTLIIEATLKADTPDKKMFTTAAEITYVNTVLDIGGKETAFAVNTADARWNWWLLFGGFGVWLLWGLLGLLILAILLFFFWKRRKEKEEEGNQAPLNR